MEAGLSKLRVLELAGEFGISPDETMALLRALEITVRNPASPLTDEQVARARVRWERDKRTHKAAAEAPPAKKKAAAKSEGDAEPKPAAKEARPETPGGAATSPSAPGGALAGRIVSVFEDGATAMLTLKTSAGAELVVYLQTDTKRSFQGLPREQQPWLATVWRRLES